MWLRLVGCLVLLLTPLSPPPGWAAGDPPTRLHGNRTYSRVYTWAPDQAWVGSAQDLIVTRDGGQTWTNLLSVYTPAQALTNMGDMGGLSAQVWWAGSPGLRVTTDGGQTWTPWPQEIFYPDGQRATTVDHIRLVSPTEAWGIEGFAPTQDPPVQAEALRHTRDAGRTWERVLLPKLGLPRISIEDIVFLSPRVGWVWLTSGHVLRTGDGGQTWERRGQLQRLLRQIAVADPETGWALESRYPYVPQIHWTRDGGLTWATGTLPPLPRETQIERLFFLDTATGWVVGDSGTILHTTDGGQTWQLQPSGTQKYLTAIHFSDAQHGWAAGAQNTILKTADGGQTWTKVDDDLKNWRP